MGTDRLDLEQQIDAATTAARGLLEELTPAQVNWLPAPGRWSVGECISHLNVGIRAVLPALDRTIDRARATGQTGQGPFRYSWIARMMIRSAEPPVRRRFKTFPVFEPERTAHDAAALLADFVAVRDELRARLARAEGLDWRRAKVTSPASRFFRMSIGAYVAFLLAHDRRHLWQAEQVRNDPGFPA